jgi:hypothetical protein
LPQLSPLQGASGERAVVPALGVLGQVNASLQHIEAVVEAFLLLDLTRVRARNDVAVDRPAHIGEEEMIRVA